MTLDEHLAACSSQSGLRPGVMTVAHHRLASAFANDEALLAEGRRRLSEINPSVLDRDHLSRWLKSTLEGTLPRE